MLTGSQDETNAKAVQKQEMKEIGLLDLVIILLKHKKMIVTVTAAMALLSTAIAFSLPNIYTGTARILPPQQTQSATSVLLGQLGGLAALAGGSLSVKNPNDLYVGILKSRTVADSIINQFGLQELYEQDTMEETRNELAENSTILAGKDGLITVQFDDVDPRRAADVANAYVAELDKLTQSLAVTEAGQRRLFFERQLQEAKHDLAEAEVALKVTQERTGLIKLDDQGKAIIEAVTALRAQIAAKEIELRSIQTFATKANPSYVRAENELVGLRTELSKLERAQIAGAGDVLLPTGKVPEAGLQYLRKLRDVKYQEAIFELLAKQFEAAKIDEAKESAVIQLVDRAIAPDKKRKPKRAVIVVLATFLAGIFASVLALMREAHERARIDPALAPRLAALRKYAALR